MVAFEILEAAEDGNLQALEGFERGVVTESVSDAFGSNCLHYAARQGGVEVLKFLVQERGFTGNGRSNIGATPGHDAAAAGNLDTLQWLLGNTECEVNDQDGTGATALHLACRFHHTHITEWLLNEAHADVNKYTASGGIPLHFAVVGGDYDAVKLLLEEDRMSVNLQCSNGTTPTYLAAQEGRTEILRLLIQDFRGNIKIKAYDGMSCLHAAAQSGHIDCVRFLVEEEKCNPSDRDFDGATPLHYAASQGHAVVIEWLMRMGGAKVTLDNLGGSPLHNAAESNQIECIKILINNGCSIDITDNNGLTAAELARKCSHHSCAELIETYKANSQGPLDADIEYLTSVQSPRPQLRPNSPNLYNGYTPNTPNYYGNHAVIQVGGQSEVERNHGVAPLIQVTPGYNTAVRPRSPVVNSVLRPDNNSLSDGRWLSNETGENESVISRVDSEEFLVGIPRTGSKDFSELDDYSGKLSDSVSASSLSSLSKLDDAVIIVTKPEPYKNQTSLVGGFSYLGPREVKSVKFQTGVGSVDVTTQRLTMDSSADKTKREEVIKNGHERKFSDLVTKDNDRKSEITISNGVSTHSKSDANNGDVVGSVEPSQTVTNNSTNALYKNNAFNTENAPNNSDHRASSYIATSLLNGSVHHAPQPPAPPSSLPLNGEMESPPSPEVNRHTSTAPPPPPISTIPKGKPMPEQADDNTPPTPAPPPPPPPPPAPAMPQLNGNGNQPAQLNGSTMQEIKAKSASLPARPMAGFSAEMMQSKRSTLARAPPKPSDSHKPASDFIAELKQATKGPALRKTTTNGQPKPMMIFSSTQQTNGTTEKTAQSKETKVELKGEWDPKNFMDQVPDREGLPVWKVQLQARQIAEKTMKETLEKRQVEEKESRFINMPAWKRALVEKKEAEAKAAEEKQREEEQQGQKLSNRRHPVVSVTPKTGDDGGVLAPWQLELQSK